MSKTKGQFLFISFAQAPQPVFKESRNGPNKWVNFGEENDYPLFLLSLYNNSNKHGAILAGKADFIAGKSIIGTSPLVKKANKYGETLHEIIRKVALDLEIFGGYYLEVIKSRGGEVAELYHIPFEQCRLNKKADTVFKKEDWKMGYRGGEQADPIPVWTPEGKVARSVFVFREYRAGMNVYPLPGYYAGLNWISADVEIGRHVLQNAQAGFMPSKLINMNDGEPTEDEKGQIEKRFNEKFTGSEGKKLIISFNANPQVAPTIADLGASDLTKEDFSRIDQLVEQNVFSGHRITSPMLFGIKTEGQLGGRSELRDAWELFNNNYVELRQEKLEASLEMLVGEIEIEEITPIGFEGSDAVMTAAIQVAPKRWLLDKLGIKEEDYPEAFAPPPTQGPQEAPGQPGQPGNTNTPPVEGAPQEMAAVKDYAVFSKFGEPRGKFAVVKNKVVKFSSHMEALEDELATVQAAEYLNFAATVTTLEGRIKKLLKDDPLMTVRDLAKSLDERRPLVQDTLDKMIKDGVIKPRIVKDQEGNPRASNDVVEGVQPETVRPSNVEIGVRYSYEVKPEFRDPNPEDPTGQIIDTSRDFCRELIRADKFYTRKDIEGMSAEMGYSVWDQKGGWMGIKGTDEKSPECRHTWVSNVVVRKQA